MPQRVPPTVDGIEATSEQKALLKDGLSWGPQSPRPDCGYHRFSNYRYLRGYAGKIKRDLIKAARMYNGREVRLYRVAQGSRCPDCTNLATGERLLSNCPRCGGTGYVDRWESCGDFWTYTDFMQRYNAATPNGNVNWTPGAREQIVIVGAPLLHDQALIIFIESREVYKIVDIEPHIVAMRGEVITQIAAAMRLSPGREEYRLIDW